MLTVAAYVANENTPQETAKADTLADALAACATWLTWPMTLVLLTGTDELGDEYDAHEVEPDETAESIRADRKADDEACRRLFRSEARWLGRMAHGTDFDRDYPELTGDGWED